jgi:hypothetical protein
MNTIVKYLFGAIIFFCLTACELDNYDAPSKKLTGKIVYNGQPVNVEKGQVRIELWESGWELKTPINIAVEPDGSYSALLFDGNYKMVIPKGQGPFLPTTNNETQSDTIIVTLRGSKTMDIEVTPFYVMRNALYQVSSNQLSSTVSVEKIINDVNARDIEYVRLFINKTQFVSNGTNIRNATINGADITDLNAVELDLEIPAIVPAQSYVYATIGIKVVGVEDMIFSPVQKINF